MTSQSVAFDGPCLDCGRTAPSSGGVAVVGDRLEWDTESDCPVCGPVLGCGRGAPPPALRDRLLAAHGAVRLDGAGGARWP
ncbi:hypothetical protein [Streptacidiphilus anmyonensis]|uniref:hypothetical protein n=1 Tax=Streptacidiphilus anmyonensis TaxID=405782 RepID=UPI000694D606|nr:hypothetical protein [Streptacidiphilus anmyonensis]